MGSTRRQTHTVPQGAASMSPVSELLHRACAELPIQPMRSKPTNTTTLTAAVGRATPKEIAMAKAICRLLGYAEIGGTNGMRS